MTIQRWNFDLATQCRGGETDRHFAMQVGAVALEDLVLLQVNNDIQVSRRSAVDTGFALA
jgi:hypothetical protein